jgi:glycosyltransferase involved in cell wall biosynthesis
VKIKVVHITQSLGGVKTYLEYILGGCDNNKFQHVIIAPEHSEFQHFCKEHSVRYYPIKIQRSINPFKDLAALFSIILILKQERPTIIQTHSAKGGFLGRLASIFITAKVIYTPHAFSYLSFKGIKRIIFYTLELMAKRWTDVLLSVSLSEANRAVYELGYNNSRVATILNAVKVIEHPPFRNYNRCVRIGMIGRLTYQKNPLLFLTIARDLLRKYPYLEFNILGAGMTDHLASEIHHFIDNNDMIRNVKILPWEENGTSERFLENIDIFLLTSVFEGLPYSLLEAMSVGLPCLVSKVDGNTDVIQNNENGFSCLSAIEFVTKLQDLIEDQGLRRKIGQSGHRYIKELHDIQYNISLHQDLYSALFSGQSLQIAEQYNTSMPAKFTGTFPSVI